MERLLIPSRISEAAGPPAVIHQAAAGLGSMTRTYESLASGKGPETRPILPTLDYFGWWFQQGFLE